MKKLLKIAGLAAVAVLMFSTHYAKADRTEEPSVGNTTTTINGTAATSFTFTATSTTSTNSVSTSTGGVIQLNIKDLTNTTNTWANLQTFNGITAGNITATSFTAGTSTATVIQNYDDILYVPTGYTSAVYGDFGTYVNNWFNARVAAGDHAVSVHVPPSGIPSGSWAVAINASSSNTVLSVQCESLAPLVWTGSNTSTFMNTGTANKTFFSGFDGCYAEGSGRTVQTFLQPGGTNGNFMTRVTNSLIRNWKRGVTPAANDPFITIDNDSFQFVDQPLYLNFNGISNSGENTYIGHTIFGGCEANNALATGTLASIYMVNNAGTVFDSDSLDDCTADVGGGSTVLVIGGWNENPGAQATPYQGVPTWTIENSGTAILTMQNPNFWNDISSSVTSTANGASTTPPYWISNLGGTLNITGGMAGALTTASSVARLVLDGATATTNITGFLNESNGVTTGVGAIFDSGNSIITMVTGAGFFNCQLNQNSYAWCQKQSNNTYSQYFANGAYMNTIVPSGAGNLALYTHWGTGVAGTSTFDILGSYACDVTTPGTATIIASNNTGGGNWCGYDSISATATSTVLPLISQTQNRIYTFKATAAGSMLIAPTSTDFLKIGTVTSTNYTITAGGNATFQNNGTYWELKAHSPQVYTTPSLSGALTLGTCDTATTSVDTWVSSANNPLPTNYTIPLGGNVQPAASYLTSSGVVTTYACGIAVVTPTSTTAKFSILP